MANGKGISDPLQLSVLGERTQLVGWGGWLAAAGGWGTDNTYGERIWSSLVKFGFLVIIHILWPAPTLLILLPFC
jgi:hypothetical protein